jgi:hypothetical protein
MVPDSKHGVATQDPESTLATINGIANVLGDVAVGVPYRIITRVGAASFAAASTEYVANVFSKDCPHKLRLLEVAFQVQEITVTDWTTGPAGGKMNLKVEHGDGAEAEDFQEIMADFEVGYGYGDGEGDYCAPADGRPLVPAYQVIDMNKSLRVTMTADPDNAIGDGASACWIDVILTVMRVN